MPAALAGLLNPDYRAAEAETEEAGAVLADLAADFYDAGGGNLRLAGHSLGGRCVYWALAKLPDDHEVETVASLGAAAHGSEICGEPWNDALSRACQVRNYYSGNDTTVGRGYDDADDTALGTEGVSCEAPAPNYEDVDVTDSVDGHLAYLGDSQVGDDLAAAITAGDCGDTTEGGTDGGEEDPDDGSSGDDCFVFCWW